MAKYRGYIVKNDPKISEWIVVFPDFPTISVPCDKPFAKLDELGEKCFTLVVEHVLEAIESGLNINPPQKLHHYTPNIDLEIDVEAIRREYMGTKTSN